MAEKKWTDLTVGEQLRSLKGKEYSKLNKLEKDILFTPGKNYSLSEIGTVFYQNGVIDDRSNEAKRKTGKL